MEQFEIEKWIWTEEDFQTMGWHDSTVYGLRFNGNLELDIDYIFKWNQPEIEGFKFTFWISPATLIFENPTKFNVELTQAFDESWLEIEDIEMTDTNHIKSWTIITRQGEISFNCENFKQIIRRKPTLQFSQNIEYNERGGFSFDTNPGNNIIVELGQEITERRKRDLELYESAKNRFALKQELQILMDKQNIGELSKDLLIQKQDVKEKINSYNRELYNTKFESW